jgi:tetratricopeptide (TPR) repeat protein
MSRPLSSVPPASIPPASSRRPRLLLFGFLIALLLIYLVLQPTLERMKAETARMKRERDANQAQAAHFKDLRSALEQTRERVTQNPNDAEAQREMAQRCEEVGNLGEALLHAEASVRLQPNDVETLVLTATLRQRLKHYDTAMEAYQQVLAVAPQEPRALTGLAYVYILFGWPLKAEALLLPAVRQQADNPHLKVSLALSYLQHDDSTHAEQLLLAVKRAAPDQAALWTPLVDVYIKEKRYPQALATAQEALQQTPDNKALLLLQGQAYYHLHDLDHARQTLQNLLTMDPDNSTAYYYLGLCANNSNQIDEAIRQMEAGLRIDPGSAPIQRVLGQLYLRVHRDTEGRKLTAQADHASQETQRQARLSYQLANHPDSADAHRQMAQVYDEQKDLPRAIMEWKQTLHYRPDDSEARTALRAALQAVGRGQEASAL